jgi:hypothetical protein
MERYAIFENHRLQKFNLTLVFMSRKLIASQEISLSEKIFVSLRPIINRPSMTPGHKTIKK